MRQLRNGSGSWRYALPVPHGFADRPYWIASLAYEFPGYTAVFLRAQSMRRLTIGDLGLQLQDQSGETLRALPVFDRRSPFYGKLPLNGWKAIAVRSEQTGGLVMVDVLTFANGFVVSIGSDTAVLHESETVFSETLYEGEREGSWIELTDPKGEIT